MLAIARRHAGKQHLATRLGTDALEVIDVVQLVGKEWHPTTALFEIYAHLLYLTSLAMLQHNHNRDAMKGAIIHCQAMAIRLPDFKGLVAPGLHLNDIIVARVEGYTYLTNHHLRGGDGAVVRAWVRSLGANLDASRIAGQLQTSAPAVSDDAVNQTGFESAMRRIHNSIGSEYLRCLKHMFAYNNDLRQLTPEQMQGLIRRGQLEAKRVESSKWVTKKKWWQFWK